MSVQFTYAPGRRFFKVRKESAQNMTLNKWRGKKRQLSAVCCIKTNVAIFYDRAQQWGSEGIQR